MKKYLLVLFFFTVLNADNLIKPIPQSISYDKQKALLGKKLFFDASLSSDEKVSCATCHNVFEGGAENSKFSKGVNQKSGTMNSPTVFNSAFNFKQFWNGRASNLAEQAKGPIHNPLEMGMDKNQIEARLERNSDYKKEFKVIYNKTKINFDDAIDAIVEFEKALITPNSKFDRYLRNEVKLTPDEMNGYITFKKLGCISCHNGINVGGNSFQKFGLINEVEGCLPTSDRYQITKNIADKNVYKVPTLRNIALTAPYFHDGSAKDLKEAIQKMSHHNLGFDVKNSEVEAIMTFLNTLTGIKPKILND